VQLKDAIQIASATIANILRLDHRKGNIAAGESAVLLVLDPDLSFKNENRLQCIDINFPFHI